MSVITRFEFRDKQNTRKYLRISRKEPVFIIKNKLAGFDTGWVLMSYDYYKKVKTEGKND